MNENDGFIFWQYYIGLAGHVFYVKAVTIAVKMQEATHQHFWLSVFALYLAHVVAAGGFVMHVCHNAKLGVRYSELYNKIVLIVVLNTPINNSSWAALFSIRPLCHQRAFSFPPKPFSITIALAKVMAKEDGPRYTTQVIPRATDNFFTFSGRKINLFQPP